MDRSVYYHAPPKAARRGLALTLQVIVPDCDGDRIGPLLYRPDGQGSTIAMQPTDGITYDGESFTVFAATLPAATLTGDALLYSFSPDGDCYHVPLYDLDQAPMEGVAIFPEAVQMPSAILPIFPTERVHLSKGNLPIRFTTAGVHPEYPEVFVKQENGFVSVPVEPSPLGCYEATVPYEMLLRVHGKLLYYITVSGGGCVASLGTAECPLSVRLLDNTGPYVTRTEPADGSCTGVETRPTISLFFEDPSGVDTDASILCLDGQKIPKGPQWGAKSVVFCPEHSLENGIHTVEAVLRDGLGNRSYHSFSFCVGEESEGTSASKPARGRPLGAALFFAGAWNTLRDLFSDKK
ncbi:MAG: hypothetical protein IJY22_01025 [Clostridia bacterium]|nr:hypothetical protein [Clostridia bacterium]